MIFTERIDTLHFLQENLPADLDLGDEQVVILHGALSDVDQQWVVEDFGREEAPVRLLIASDVAAEGINLHYLCHRLIHFDIPWSLMLFQQRNGRIDRYGQNHTPRIVYLLTASQNLRIRGDTRILEVLIEKDEQAVKNIGDPAAFMGLYDIAEEEKVTAQAMEGGIPAETFAADLTGGFDPLAALLGELPPPAEVASPARESALPAVLTDDYAYLATGIDYLRQTRRLQAFCYPEERRVELTAPEDLRQRFRSLPPEIWPEEGHFILSADRAVIEREIARSRKEERAWPRVH